MVSSASIRPSILYFVFHGLEFKGSNSPSVAKGRNENPYPCGKMDCHKDCHKDCHPLEVSHNLVWLVVWYPIRYQNAALTP